MNDKTQAEDSVPSTAIKNRSLVQRGLDAIFGYDFFISYTRRDGGKDYAEALARQLEAANFEIFFDNDDYAMGDDWKIEGKWALRRTGQLVLVASPEALSSSAVVREVEVYSSLRNRRIIPIDFDGTIRNRDETKPIFRYLKPEILFIEEDAACLKTGPSKFIVQKLQDGFNLKRQDKKRSRIFGIVASILVVLTVIAVWYAIQANLARNESERLRILAVEARDEALRKQKRAEGAELRGLLQRLDSFVGPATATGDELALAQLGKERAEIASRLHSVTREHQKLLAQSIDFRGDLEFLMRWEGHAGKVQILGRSIYIDPSTDLALTDEQTVRDRYAFLLTPDELQAVVAAVGKRGADAEAVFQANPILQRITLAPADVARLVPEVAAPLWQKLADRFPTLIEKNTPAAVHTAVLSATYNLGTRFATAVAGDMSDRNWLGVADTIEAYAQDSFHRKLPGLATKRLEEAALIRSAFNPEVE